MRKSTYADQITKSGPAVHVLRHTIVYCSSYIVISALSRSQRNRSSGAQLISMKEKLCSSCM
ncbi:MULTISPECIES: hypothetical protein [unclassified Paenibacillus]|uniref:hypothetical protein n=1 Tax=unclassified Paenibacillus TaxID=185978 RepID=UPI002F40F849